MATRGSRENILYFLPFLLNSKSLGLKIINQSNLTETYAIFNDSSCSSSLTIDDSFNSVPDGNNTKFINLSRTELFFSINGICLSGSLDLRNYNGNNKIECISTVSFLTCNDQNATSIAK